MKPKKQIPRFKNEDEEREFWATHDSTDYIDWDSATIVDFSHLRKNLNQSPDAQQQLEQQRNVYLPRTEIEPLLNEIYDKLRIDDVKSATRIIESLLAEIRNS